MKKYDTALVLGLGKSGHSAAELLVAENTKVTVADCADNDQLRMKSKDLSSIGVQVHLGIKKLGDIFKGGCFDVCVISPGIDLAGEWAQSIRKLGITVISELDLGVSRVKCPVIGITGTNGKSTMVKLCSEALAFAGCKTAVAGNYGYPVCGMVQSSKSLDWLVVEISSFQLEATEIIKPKVGVVLNVQSNHLDRHGSMETYTKLKASLFKNMDSSDYALVEESILPVMKSYSGSLVEWKTFGTSKNTFARYQGGCIEIKTSSGIITVNIRGTMFDNEIMGSTAAAACAVIAVCEEDPKIMANVAKTFEPLPHRMQQVGAKNGISYINNSKATTLAALAASLKMVNGKVHVLAGGLLKEHDLEAVKPDLKKKAIHVYLFGNAAQELDQCWKDCVKTSVHANMKEALYSACQNVRTNETVLLAPACTSFDQFKNFEERGNHFIDLVQEYLKRSKT